MEICIAFANVAGFSLAHTRADTEKLKKEDEKERVSEGKGERKAVCFNVTTFRGSSEWSAIEYEAITKEKERDEESFLPSGRLAISKTELCPMSRLTSV